MKTLLYILLLFSLTFAERDQDDPGFKLHIEIQKLALATNFDSAIKKCDELIKTYPKSGFADDAYYWKAYSLKEQKKYDESFLVYQKLLEKYPETSLKWKVNSDLGFMLTKVNTSNRSAIEKIFEQSKGNAYVFYNSSAPSVASVNLIDATHAVGVSTSDFTDELITSYELADVDDAFIYDVDDPQGSMIFDGYATTINASGHRVNLSDEEKIQVEAIKSYYKTNGKDSRTGLRKILNNDAKSENVKNVALQYYLRVETDLDEVISMYEDMNSLYFKQSILNNLYRFQGESESDVRSFTSKILNDKDAEYELKKSALFSLSRINDSFDELEEAYVKNEHLSLRKSIISTMTRKYPNESKDFIMKIIKSSNEKESVRKNAVYYLSRNLKELNKLKELYGSLDNQNLMKEVIYSIYRLNTDESVDYLISLMKNKKTPVNVRTTIIHWLGKSKNPKASAAISDILFE